MRIRVKTRMRIKMRREGRIRTTTVRFLQRQASMVPVRMGPETWRVKLSHFSGRG